MQVFFVSPMRSHLRKDKGQNRWFVGRQAHTQAHVLSILSLGCYSCLSAVSASPLALRRSQKGENKKGHYLRGAGVKRLSKP